METDIDRQSSRGFAVVFYFFLFVCFTSNFSLPLFFFCNSISNSNIKGNSIRCGTNRSNGASKRNARIPRSFSLFSFFFKSRLFKKKEKLDTLVQTLFHRCVITNKFEITASHHTTASSLIPLDRNRDSAGSFDLITDTPTRDRSNQAVNYRRR